MLAYIYVNAHYCHHLEYAQFLFNRGNYHKIPYYATLILLIRSVRSAF